MVLTQATVRFSGKAAVFPHAGQFVMDRRDPANPGPIDAKRDRADFPRAAPARFMATPFDKRFCFELSWPLLAPRFSDQNAPVSLVRSGGSRIQWKHRVDQTLTEIGGAKRAQVLVDRCSQVFGGLLAQRPF